MKKITVTVMALFLVLAIQAQSSVTSVEYQKMQRQAVVCEVPFAEKTVAGAIDDKFEKMGYKGKDSKGYVVYRGVKLSEISNDPVDMYFMVDRKSRKEKETSIITLLLSKGFEEFMTEKDNPEVFQKAKVYLDSIRNSIADYDLELQIKEQEDVVKDNDKKAAKLVEEAEDLQKKKKKLEKDIEDNIKNQADQKTEIEKQQQILETLKAKRRH